MEIKPTYVTFEQAKLLKEKGFYVKVEWAYQDKNLVHDSHCKELKNWNDKNHVDCSAPEQHQVVEWLRVNHGIWVLVLPQDKSAIDYRIGENKYPSHALFFSIIKYKEDCSCKECINTSDDKGELFLHFDSPQEAYSAAFDYILNNDLI